MGLSLIVLFIFILFPIIGLPIYFFLFVFDKKRNSMFYPILLGVSLGIISYYFIPKVGYDLIKNQAVVQLFRNISFKTFLDYTKVIDLEFLPLLYSYIISFFNNVNLLQFFVVSIGYALLFYMLYDFRKIKNIDYFSFIVLTIFIIFGFNTLYFISGLYCYIGIIIFALGIYYEYIKKKNKAICYSLYILSLFVHSSLFLPAFLLIMFKINKEKFNINTIVACFLIFVFALEIISLFNNIFPSVIFTRIIYMYNNYVTKNEHYKIYYSGTILFIELSKLLITLLFTFIDRNKKENIKTNDYILLLSLSTILMLFRARVTIRYVMLIQFIGIIPITSVISRTKGKNKLLLSSVIMVFGMFYLLHFISIFSEQSFGLLFDNKFYNTIFTIFN